MQDFSHNDARVLSGQFRSTTLRFWWSVGGYKCFMIAFIFPWWSIWNQWLLVHVANRLQFLEISSCMILITIVHISTSLLKLLELTVAEIQHQNAWVWTEKQDEHMSVTTVVDSLNDSPAWTPFNYGNGKLGGNAGRQTCFRINIFFFFFFFQFMAINSISLSKIEILIN